ncbi:MAG: hypothetical protein ACRDOU_32745 [Streptosporangiaceae bacterium]
MAGRSAGRAAASTEELLVKGTTRPGKLDRYKPCLRQRWTAR